MKKNFLIQVGIYFLVVILYFVNIGAFVVTYVTKDFALQEFGAGFSRVTGKSEVFNHTKGDTLSWAQASNAQVIFGDGGVVILLVAIAIFWFIAYRLISSFTKDKKTWKKVVAIASNLSVLKLAYSLFTDLTGCSGEVNWVIPPDKIHIYTFSTTGTVYVLYIAVFALMAGIILQIVSDFRLSGQVDNQDKEKQSVS